MGKIAPVSAKYIISAVMNAEGIVEKPDIIGAIFGQTEGLLGKDMELRELQKSGRIGRIEVETKLVDGRTQARITIPSSLDKTETAIIAAAVETIERIGPCDGKIVLEKIEDMRINKRDYIQGRAKEILSKFMESEAPESQELADEVKSSVRSAQVITWGVDKLTAGPDVESAPEIILVEGRADVLKLLKNGINNAISTNGTSVPKSLSELMNRKTTTAFVDGDRGGELIIKSLAQSGKLDYIAKAPDGKEVEELASKEIFKALRAREPYAPQDRRDKPVVKEERRASGRRVRIPSDSRDLFAEALKNVSGSMEAEVYDNNHKLLGRVPVKSIKAVTNLGDVYAVIMDGVIDEATALTVKKARAQFLIGKDSNVTKGVRGLTIITEQDF